jgi:hypothetical protein
VPGGSNYPGPTEALELYIAAVDRSTSGVAVKGAKNPYTSLNGHMFSFLDGDGAMALRMSDELRESFEADYETGPVIQYGSVMRGYASIPDDLLHDPDTLAEWFDKAHAWIATLDPKPTKK